MMHNRLIKRSCNLGALDVGHLECGVHTLLFLQIQYCAYNWVETHTHVYAHIHTNVYTQC